MSFDVNSILVFLFAMNHVMICIVVLYCVKFILFYNEHVLNLKISGDDCFLYERIPYDLSS